MHNSYTKCLYFRAFHLFNIPKQTSEKIRIDKFYVILFLYLLRYFINEIIKFTGESKNDHENTVLLFFYEKIEQFLNNMLNTFSLLRIIFNLKSNY